MGIRYLQKKPTFYGACGAFLSRGGNVITVSMEQDGINMSELEIAKVYHLICIYGIFSNTNRNFL